MPMKIAVAFTLGDTVGIGVRGAVAFALFRR